jgi:hypothetical protein
MMPQREVSRPIHEHNDDQTYARQHYETFYEQSLREGAGEKVYVPIRDNKNILRFVLAVFAMVMLLMLAILFIFSLGGTGGWISFCAASLVIFLIAVVAIEKMQ